MTRLTKSLTVFVATIATAGVFFAATAMAQQASQELTPAQVEAVRSNCVTSQASLQRLRDSDLIGRTIHGRSYNDLSLLIKAFNSRIAFNGINAPDLIAVPTSLDTTYSAFYDHYTSYAASLNETLQINCTGQPERFYTLFLKTQQHRLQLAKDVSDMQKLIGEYRKGVLELREELASPASGGSQ